MISITKFSTTRDPIDMVNNTTTFTFSFRLPDDVFLLHNASSRVPENPLTLENLFVAVMPAFDRALMPQILAAAAAARLTL